LYFYSLILFYITLLSKRRGEKGAFTNNITNSVVFIISITLNLTLGYIKNPLASQFISFPFDLLFVSFIVVFIPIFAAFVVREKRRIEKGKSNFKEFKSTSLNLPLKYDIYRKLTHLVVLGIIFFYFTLGFLIQNFFTYIFDFLPDFFTEMFNIGDNIMVFTQNLVLFLVGVSLIGLLTADFTRILKPKYYPLKSVNQILKEKELHMRLGPHISMSIGCFSIILLYGIIQPIGPMIISTSMIMAIFGDIAANLIGRTKGKRSIRSTNKTYEGLFAGIIVAFISGFIILSLLNKIYKPKNFGLILIPLIGAIIIGLIDFANLEIDDNLSYNFILSTVLFFSSVFLF
jgi:dolichol kinase